MTKDPNITAIEKYSNTLVSLILRSKLELKIIFILNILMVKKWPRYKKIKMQKRLNKKIIFQSN